MITFDEYMNTKHYRDKILSFLKSSRPTLSASAFEALAASFRREITSLEAELEGYETGLLQNSISASTLAGLIVATIDGRVSMVVKSSGNVLWNTPLRVAPDARLTSFSPKQTLILSQAFPLVRPTSSVCGSAPSAATCSATA